MARARCCSSPTTCWCGFAQRSRRPHHNAPGPILPPEQVTVTMPIHPLRGLKLKLLGLRRDHLTRRQTLIAEAADGSQLVLPVEWTDRGAPWAVPTLRGKPVRLCAHGLLLVGRAVATALCRKLDPPPQACSAWPQAEHAEQRDVSCRDRAGRLGMPDTSDAARPARGVGKSAAQDAQRRRGPR